MVQVTGEKNEAFLYDTSNASPVFIKYLGERVEKVRFSGGKNGKPVKILVEFSDNNFALFNNDGDSLDVDTPHDAPPLPESPPPTDAPPADSENTH
jgi:hypothetical protein